MDVRVKQNIRNIAQIIRLYIERENLTIDEFAERVGVSRRYLMMILAGDANPTINLLEKIYEVCGVDAQIFHKLY